MLNKQRNQVVVYTTNKSDLFSKVTGRWLGPSVKVSLIWTCPSLECQSFTDVF